MCNMESVLFTNLSKYKKLHEKKICTIHEKYDLRKIDVEIIIYLANCGEEDTARNIANTKMFTKGHISQSVKRLTDMGFVEAKHDENDMRVQHLKLTNKVQPLLDELLAQREKMERSIFVGVTDEEAKVMKRVFEKICANIMKEMNGD